MPITQTRLLDVLSAGEHFQHVAATLRSIFNSKCSAIFARTITFEQAFSDLTIELNSFTEYDSKAASVLMRERVRFNLTHKRNSIERRRLQSKRQASALSEPSPPLPTSTRPPRRTIAEVAAAADSTDEAFDALSDLTLPDDDLSPSSSHLDSATKALLDAEIAALCSAPSEPHKSPIPTPTPHYRCLQCFDSNISNPSLCQAPGCPQRPHPTPEPTP